jgi:hypothetical protein
VGKDGKPIEGKPIKTADSLEELSDDMGDDIEV